MTRVDAGDALDRVNRLLHCRQLAVTSERLRDEESSALNEALLVARDELDRVRTWLKVGAAPRAGFVDAEE